MSMIRSFAIGALLGATGLMGMLAQADPPGTTTPPAEPAATAEPSAPADRATRRAQAFAEAMSGVKLVGKFTVEGMKGDPKEEAYLIKSVRHLGKDLYLFEAQVKYGDVDSTIALPMTVLYAGDTPVITLDEFAIPGMGTFDARVMIHSRMYAGTWKHGDKGGLLYGKIEKADAKDLAPAE